MMKNEMMNEKLLGAMRLAALQEYRMRLAACLLIQERTSMS
jgi:hypothetical protein